MHRKTSLIVGVACGIACVAGVLLYVQDARADMEAQREEALARYGGEQVEVYVATRDIAVGDSPTAANMEKRLWLGELLPRGAITDLRDLEGLQATSSIYAGEVVILARFGETYESALHVPEGLCAVSVPARSVSAVGGSIKPGSQVDVWATSGTATDRIASRVLVLSTSATAASQSTADVSWVTLAVDPGLVEELIAAAQKEELYFSLPGDGASIAQEDLTDVEAEDAEDPEAVVGADQLAEADQLQKSGDDQSAAAEADAQPAEGSAPAGASDDSAASVHEGGA